MLWKYAGLSATFTPTILTRQTHIQFMLQLILLASQSASCLSNVHSETNPTTFAFSADRLSSFSWIHMVDCCLPSPSATMVCLLHLVLSFLNALRQAMPTQMETLFLLLNSKAHSCFVRQRVGVIILCSEITHVVGVHGSSGLLWCACWFCLPLGLLSFWYFGEWPPVPRCCL